MQIKLSKQHSKNKLDMVPDLMKIDYDLDEQDILWTKLTKTVPIRTLQKVLDLYDKLYWYVNRPFTYEKLRRQKIQDLEEHCGVCRASEESNDDIMVMCDGCDLIVHQYCYGLHLIPDGAWFCDSCTCRKNSPIECQVCPNKGGYMKRSQERYKKGVVCNVKINDTDTTKNKDRCSVNGNHTDTNRKKYICNPENAESSYSHAVCHLWNQATSFTEETCILCNSQTHPHLVKCSEDECDQQYHIRCGQLCSLYIDTQKLISFCPFHTPEPSQKYLILPHRTIEAMNSIKLLLSYMEKVKIYKTASSLSSYMESIETISTLYTRRKSESIKDFINNTSTIDLHMSRVQEIENKKEMGEFRTYIREFYNQIINIREDPVINRMINKLPSKEYSENIIQLLDYIVPVKEKPNDLVARSTLSPVETNIQSDSKPSAHEVDKNQNTPKKRKKFNKGRDRMKSNENTVINIKQRYKSLSKYIKEYGGKIELSMGVENKLPNTIGRLIPEADKQPLMTERMIEVVCSLTKIPVEKLYKIARYWSLKKTNTPSMGIGGLYSGLVFGMEDIETGSKSIKEINLFLTYVKLRKELEYWKSKRTKTIRRIVEFYKRSNGSEKGIEASSGAFRKDVKIMISNILNIGLSREDRILYTPEESSKHFTWCYILEKYYLVEIKRINRRSLYIKIDNRTIVINKRFISPIIYRDFTREAKRMGLDTLQKKELGMFIVGGE
eukprot:GHVP01049065.1.p1 GENE.GHVP01049065.1~~GHVP01049065.1.p1  ORF type:complete len:724 (+),score=93.72 GHVP01049065.1:916-3087(+)